MKRFTQTNYPDIFRTAQMLMDAYWPPVDTDDYVQQLCGEANEAAQRYAGKPEEEFYYALLYAVLNELCRPLAAAKKARLAEENGV